ncbi:MAG TPA: hypothetical protein VGO59_14700 [Verrucomicrobiae bacterium]|jgi:hypothetical protein
MKKFAIIALLAGVGACLVIHHRSQIGLRAGEAALQEQNSQLAALRAERDRLAQPSGAPARDQAAELAKLRDEAKVLRKQTNDLAEAAAKKQDSPPPRSTSNPARTPEYYEQLHRLSNGRNWEARDLGRAFGEYAEEHENQSASSLGQLASYLAKNNAALSGSNQYEIIFHGSLDQLKGLPRGSIAVVRDAQPWPGPDGKMRRVYGFPDGHSQIILDNLQPWISEHVISENQN